MQSLIEEVRKEFGPLYKVADGIAMLDMIVSFCQLCTIQDYSEYSNPCLQATSNPLQVRPEFTNTLGIKSGRHPLREKIHKTKYVPNDAYASVESRFQIITGMYGLLFVTPTREKSDVFKAATCLERFKVP